MKSEWEQKNCYLGHHEDGLRTIQDTGREVPLGFGGSMTLSSEQKTEGVLLMLSIKEQKQLYIFSLYCLVTLDPYF